jgi:nucleoside-diphosphate-sugar epimerase
MRALVLGGSGQIGIAMAEALTRAGWQVTATTRNERALPPSLSSLGVQRADGDTRHRLIGQGWDLVIDTLAFTEGDAAALIGQRHAYGRLCVISTGSVYADAQGRGFETDKTRGFPKYPFQIGEDQGRVLAGIGHSAQKVAIEDALFAADLPLILLRPAAIHGPGARYPRDWVVVKRLLDGRTFMPMAQSGQTVFHTTSTVSMASLTLIFWRTVRVAHSMWPTPWL